jgi:hypothetical protein
MFFACLCYALLRYLYAIFIFIDAPISTTIGTSEYQTPTDRRLSPNATHGRIAV